MFIATRPAVIPGAMGMSGQASLALLAMDMQKLGMDFKSFKQPLEDSVREVAIPSIKENFADESYMDTSSRVRKWRQLRPWTQADRERRGFNPVTPILRRSNKLYNAATAFARWKVESERAFVRGGPPGVPYFNIQHYGGTGGLGTVIPARPFMTLRPHDHAEVQAVFTAWVAKRVNQRLMHGLPVGAGAESMLERRGF